MCEDLWGRGWRAREQLDHGRRRHDLPEQLGCALPRLGEQAQHLVGYESARRCCVFGVRLQPGPQIRPVAHATAQQLVSHGVRADRADELDFDTAHRHQNPRMDLSAKRLHDHHGPAVLVDDLAGQKGSDVVPLETRGSQVRRTDLRDEFQVLSTIEHKTNLHGLSLSPAFGGLIDCQQEDLAK